MLESGKVMKFEQKHYLFYYICKKKIRLFNRRLDLEKGNMKKNLG